MSERKHMPQLDALRVFAIIGVLLVHNWRPGPLPGFWGSLDWGDLGVRLFFVLSGFLITGILLDCRDLAGAASGSSRVFVTRFYIRRFLRIFPVYYLVLAIVFLTDVPPARAIFPWLLTYTTNFYITLSGHWIGYLGHFWSLAVEEQFYFFWPWLVIFAPRKLLIPAISGLILLAPLYRMYAATMFPADIISGAFTQGTFTLACLDGLGFGALLALLLRRPESRASVYRILKTVVLPLGLVSFVVVQLLYYYDARLRLFHVLTDFSAGLVFCWLVAAASKGFKGRLGQVLEFRPLVYVGKISYGIYIYHNLVPLLLAFVATKIGLSYTSTGFAGFASSTVATVAIAALSWEVFEHPINNLKRYFPYAPRAIPGRALTSPATSPSLATPSTASDVADGRHTAPKIK